MDWYTIGVAIALLIILLVANIYFMAHNAHPNDSPFGQNIIMRILVVFGFTISYTPILMVPLDISNSQSNGGLNMETLWGIILIIQVSCVWVLFPIFIVFYESNEQDQLYEIPVEEAIQIGLDPSQSELKDGVYRGRLDFLTHLIGVMAWIGSILFCFFGGVGFISLPYDLIYEYIYMPQPIQDKEFQRRKQILLNYTMKLREMGKQIENERQYVALIKGYSGWRKRRAFNKKIRIFESRSLLAEKEFRILDMEANYSQKVEPLRYTFKLVLGIICALLTLNWFAQIFMLTLIDMKLSIFGSFIFVIMAFYLLIISVKGNSTYGYRTACFTFYPITENETQLNSFLFNAMLMNVLTTYIVQFTCEQLNSLVNTAYFYKLIMKTKYCTFFYVFSKYSIFSFFLMIVSIITFFTLVIRGGRRIKFSELEKNMKGGKGGKGGSKSQKNSKKDIEKGKKQSKTTLIQNDEEDDEDNDDDDDD
ncbi:UNKNOWN [Stylonychia lemnae]|uniref:Uncharacterized protein n=1 Tax=Stylonychia lemnae TaxID=5949 RepID=A0A078B366_STYLE|nr:UNKNOWN [Stylonychia lemnae]|eukprot:CDW87933.1 UNKNOWN [Stylonychia lemnae]